MAERLRRIVVDGVPYRWRFDDVLVVIPGDRSGPQLYVDWGWRDWLEPDGPGAEPLVVTPRFVADAVRFAAAYGWPSGGGGRPLRLGFQGGSFNVATQSAEYHIRPVEVQSMSDGDLRDALAAFVGAFEEVFERDWECAKVMLSPTNIDSFVTPGATFLNPCIKAQEEDWVARAELLARYRQLLQVMRKHGIQPKKPW